MLKPNIRTDQNTKEEQEIEEILKTSLKPVDMPENALDVIKEALDIVHKEEEKRLLIFRQFDNLLARERIIKMLKDDGVY